MYNSTLYHNHTAFEPRSANPSPARRESRSHKSSKGGLVKGGIPMLFANQPVKFRMSFAPLPHLWHHQKNTGCAFAMLFANPPHKFRMSFANSPKPPPPPPHPPLINLLITRTSSQLYRSCLNTFSKVSGLVHALCQVRTERTFENALDEIGLDWIRLD